MGQLFNIIPRFSTSLQILVSHSSPCSPWTVPFPGSLRIPLLCCLSNTGVVFPQRMSYPSPPSLPNVNSKRILSSSSPYLSTSYLATSFCPKQFVEALIYKYLKSFRVCKRSIPCLWSKEQDRFDVGVQQSMFRSNRYFFSPSDLVQSGKCNLCFPNSWLDVCFYSSVSINHAPKVADWVSVLRG